MTMRITVWLFALVLFVLTPGRVFAGESGRLDRIRVGSPSLRSVSYLPWEMAIKEGFFKAQGLDVELVLIRGAQILQSALTSGDLDYTAQGGGTVRFAGLGRPIKLVFLIQDRAVHFLLARPEIRQVSDLTGKKIGVAGIGDTTHIVGMRILKRYDVDPRDANFLGLLTEDAILAALLGGRVDAAFLVEPERSNVKAKGYKELAWAGDYVQIPYSGMGVMERVIQTNPDQVLRMVRALYRGFNLIKANKERSVAFMVKEWKVSREVAERSYDTEIRAYTKEGIATEEAIQEALRFAREGGWKIPENVPGSQLTDFSYLRKVQKEGS
jgi:NitT/TauT family transport system substrate-binding protein